MRFVIAVALTGVALGAPGRVLAKDAAPKLLVTAVPSTAGHAGLLAANPPVLRYADVHADAAGATHVRYCALRGFALKSYAPPAAPQWLGVPPGEIASISYGVLPVGYVGAWHHSPGPQWVFVLSGRWSVETTDGTVLEQGPGEFQFNAEDGATPQGAERHLGHLTRQVGDVPNVQLIVSLKKGSTARPAASCDPAAR